ncbi:MAG: RidA family protein [Deltaproteobacteria bacterium]|nr:RidA family protein [Deltaproteobacteria bacterium]MBW2307007.1 RidA family protein [Deltaproteobacteria bacterium]
MHIEKRLEELGLTLPPASTPVANYVSSVQSGNLLFLSGHGPGKGEGKMFKGRLGEDLNIEDGYASARQVALNLLSTLKSALGDLDRVKRTIKVTGFVNSAPGFYDQPKVINGASDLLVEVFGDKGRHARSAIGMAALPGCIPVEIELIVEVTD